MRIAPAVFIATIFCSFSGICQAPPAANEAPPQSAAPAPVALSGLLRPSLNTVQQTLADLNTGRWKRGTVREEAEANINDLQREIQDLLPPVMAAADAAPDALSNTLPLSRHIDLLYDVLLRVVEAARVSGTGDDAAQLQQALIKLGTGRRALNDRLQETAAAQEKQIGDLRSALKAQVQAAHTAPAPPAPVPCTPPSPARKPKKRPAPAKPQTTPAPATKQ